MKRLLKGLSPEGEALLNLIPGGVMQCRNDSSYTIVEVNDGFLSMFGYTREELDERFQNRFFQMIHPSDQQNFLIEAERQLEKGDRLSLSYRVLCRDGSYKWIASSEKLFGDEKEERFFCIFLDLTEVRDAQEKLRLSLEHLEIIMNQSSDIIFEWDLIADSISFSPNWLEKFGYAPHYDGRQQKEEMLHNFYPDDVEPMAAFMEEAKRGISDWSLMFGSAAFRISISGAGYGRRPSTVRKTHRFGRWGQFQILTKKNGWWRNCAEGRSWML